MYHQRLRLNALVAYAFLCAWSDSSVVLVLANEDGISPSWKQQNIPPANLAVLQSVIPKLTQNRKKYSHLDFSKYDLFPNSKLLHEAKSRWSKKFRVIQPYTSPAGRFIDLSSSKYLPGDIVMVRKNSASGKPLVLVYAGEFGFPDEKDPSNERSFFIFPFGSRTGLEYNTFPPRWHQTLIAEYKPSALQTSRFDIDGDVTGYGLTVHWLKTPYGGSVFLAMDRRSRVGFRILRPRPLTGWKMVLNRAPRTTSNIYESTLLVYNKHDGADWNLVHRLEASVYADNFGRGRIADGTYEMHLGFHFRKNVPKKRAKKVAYAQKRFDVLTSGLRPAIILQSDGEIPRRDANKQAIDRINEANSKRKPPRESISFENLTAIHIHNGKSNSNERGSEGCITVSPRGSGTSQSQWEDLMKTFLQEYPKIEDWLTNKPGRPFRWQGRRTGLLEVKGQ